MYMQDVTSVYDLVWTRGPQGVVTYGDVYHQNEVEQSTYNFEQADTDELFHQFDVCERESKRMSEEAALYSAGADTGTGGGGRLLQYS